MKRNPLERVDQTQPSEAEAGGDDARGSEATEQAVRHAIDHWLESLRHGDGSRLESLYASDAVRYEGDAPARSIGAAAIRLAWESCLKTHQGRFHAETTDIDCCAAPGRAMARVVLRLTSEESTTHDEAWLDVTLGLGSHEGHWRIGHEHVAEAQSPEPEQYWVIRGPRPSGD